MRRCVQALGGLSLIITFIASVVVFLMLCTAIVKGAEVEKLEPPLALDSLHDPVLDVFAQAHAERQAAWCCQGHQGSERRAAKLLAVFPGARQVAEICAESWSRQAHCTEAELWAEAVRCWRKSPGHWSVARKKHWRIGAGLARGKNGVWYMCLIAVD